MVARRHPDRLRRLGRLRPESNWDLHRPQRGWDRHDTGHDCDGPCAGSHPNLVHPNAIRVLAERGIDISDAQSKPITQFSGRHFEYVITLCDKVREICPEFAGQRRAMHWSIEDPSRLPGTLRATLPAFRAVAADLESRIGFVMSLINNDSTKEHTRHV